MAKSSIRELLDHLNTDFDGGPGTCVLCGDLASRVERVLTLHEEWDEQPVCRGCGSPWPCPTVRALEGEE